MSTLANIRKKVRRLTGRPSPQQITDSQIDEYINTFYQFDFPEHLRVFSNTATFQFLTEANVDQYDLREMDVSFDGSTEKAVNVYYNLMPPVYVAGYQSFYGQSREQFFRIYPALGDILSTLEGDGTIGPYTFTLSSIPIQQYSVSIGTIDSTGATIKVIDSPIDRTTGNWVISLLDTSIIGSINYITGVCTITFDNAIPDGNEITVIFTPYVSSRPQAVLFYDNIITLRPIPDKVYPVTLNAFLTPSALLSSGQHPILNLWWQYLAYGASKKIFEDSQDAEGVEQVMAGFKEQEQLVLNRHVVQQTNDRTATIYTEMTAFPYNNFNNRF